MRARKKGNEYQRQLLCSSAASLLTVPILIAVASTVWAATITHTFFSIIPKWPLAHTNSLRKAPESWFNEISRFLACWMCGLTVDLIVPTILDHNAVEILELTWTRNRKLRKMSSRCWSFDSSTASIVWVVLPRCILGSPCGGINSRCTLKTPHWAHSVQFLTSKCNDTQMRMYFASTRDERSKFYWQIVHGCSVRRD